MAKTRSQTRTITVKKEEEDHKDTQLLHSVNNTAGNSIKITKRKSSRGKNSRLPDQQVKVEQDADIKLVLNSTPKTSKVPKTQPISQEQIRQLIRYIVNDKMSVLKASKKTNIHYDGARQYYNTYKNDPEKKIPAPKKNRNFCTQEQITTLITSIIDDGMPLLEASAKANMSYHTGRKHYRKYKGNQNVNIPMTSSQKFMQERITKLIGYLTDGKMSVRGASAKANMDYRTAMKYYRKYLNDPNREIPVVDLHAHCRAYTTQYQINKLIGYIVTDKMSIRAAAKRAKLSEHTASKYYQRYNNDPNHRIPVACTNKGVRATMPQDKIKRLISYITKDKMTVKAASIKAKMAYISGMKYYKKYRNDPNSIIATPSQSAICTQEQISKLISIIVNDKTTIKYASAKTSMSLETGERYYQQYLNDPHHYIPAPTHIVRHQRCTEEQVNTFIRYIVHDKMSINAASLKTNMSPGTGGKYYKRHINDPNNVIPTHLSNRATHTQEQVVEFIRYIVEDKMTIKAASKKAKMNYISGQKYYHQYINNPSNQVPTHVHHSDPCTQEQIDNLIRYIVDDKMSVKVASKMSNMSDSSGYKYYNLYLRDRQ